MRAASAVLLTPPIWFLDILSHPPTYCLPLSMYFLRWRVWTCWRYILHCKLRTSKIRSVVQHTLKMYTYNALSLPTPPLSLPLSLSPTRLFTDLLRFSDEEDETSKRAREPRCWGSCWPTLLDLALHIHIGGTQGSGASGAEGAAAACHQAAVVQVVCE